MCSSDLLINKDGDYWLEPEMYEDFEPFYDYESIDLLWQNVPGYYGTPNNFSFIPGLANPYYYMPDVTGVAWDEGRNELFRDTYRYNFEMNHSVTQSTFYTFRWSRFTQDQFQGVRWRDNDKDGYPNWFE